MGISKNPAGYLKNLSKTGVAKQTVAVFSETPWPIKAKFYIKHLKEEGTNVFINNPSHMTKTAAMSIYVKNPSKIFSISSKLGIKHWGLKYYNVFINHIMR